MKIFLDTANLTEIDHILEWGIIEGVTTNQKIFSNEKGCNFEERVREICRRVSGPVSVELTTQTISAMIEEALNLHSWAPDKIVIKVPMRSDGSGLALTHILAKKKVRTNLTALISPEQALLAVKAGATYVSFFYNRAKDAGEDIESHIRVVRNLIDQDLIETQIIIGSIRAPSDVTRAFQSGAHIVTIPYNIICKMPFHAMTDSTLAEFDKAWQYFKQGPANVPSDSTLKRR